MVFSSFLFLFYFLPPVLALYFLVPKGLKNLILILASLLFYAWGEPFFVGSLLGLCVLDFWIAQGIQRWSKWSKSLLILSLTINISALVYFKYSNFFIEELNHLVTLVDGSPLLQWRKIILPVGISFFTFHKISYVVDVYRKIRPACSDPIKFLLYILFFPQLIAGPIVRYHEIEEQLHDRPSRLADVFEGFVRFSIGLGKKVLVADVVGHTADKIFGLKASGLTTELAWLGLSAYTAQIYFDFSGYSDMAIGLARMFGFRFPENFNKPYMASSFTDFWRRWHISFGRWMREYLYYPLGGAKVGVIRQYLNLWIVFLFSGLWHGAEWTFILWGVWHGFFMTLERLFLAKQMIRLPYTAQVLLTLFMVMLSRVLFRAKDLSHAGNYFYALVNDSMVKRPPILGSVTSYYEMSMIVFAYLICLYPLIPLLNGAISKLQRLLSSNAIVSDILLGTQAIILLFLSAAAMAGTDFSPFIYFQF